MVPKALLVIWALPAVLEVLKLRKPGLLTLMATVPGPRLAELLFWNAKVEKSLKVWVAPVLLLAMPPPAPIPLTVKGLPKLSW